MFFFRKRRKSNLQLLNFLLCLLLSLNLLVLPFLEGEKSQRKFDYLIVFCRDSWDCRISLRGLESFFLAGTGGVFVFGGEGSVFLGASCTLHICQFPNKESVPFRLHFRRRHDDTVIG